jgi:hypothetical protein
MILTQLNKGPSKPLLIFNLISNGIAYLAWAFIELVFALWLPLLFFALFLAWEYGSLYLPDILLTVKEAYEIFAFTINWIIDRLNDILQLIRPFIEVYNAFLWLLWSICVAIFENISAQQFAYLLEQLALALYTIMPTVVAILKALLPVLMSLLPSIIAIFTELVINLVPVFVLIVQQVAQLIIALMPMVAQLIPLVFTVLINMLNNFAPVITQLINVILNILIMSIPFLSQLITIITGLVTAIAAKVTSGMNFFAFLVVVLVESIPFLVQILITVVDALIKLVLENFSAIITIIKDLIIQLVLVIPPIITMTINLILTALPVIVNLISVIINAIVELVPVVVTVLLELIDNGSISEIFDGVIELLLLAPSSVVALPPITPAHSGMRHILQSLPPQTSAVLTAFVNKIVIFVQDNVSKITSALTTLFDAFVAAIPPLVAIFQSFTESNILPDLLRALINLLVDIIPMLVSAFLSLLQSIATPAIGTLLRSLIAALIDIVVQLIDPLINLVLVLIGGPLIDMAINILLALVRLIPVLLTMILQLLLNPSGFAIIKILFQTLVDFVVGFFANAQIDSLIKDLLIAVLNGLLSVFSAGGQKMDFGVFGSIINFVFTVVGGFFKGVIKGLTGNLGIPGLESINPLKSIIEYVEIILSWVKLVTDAIESVTSILDRLKVLDFAMAALKAITDILEPIVGLINQIVAAIESLF